VAPSPTILGAYYSRRGEDRATEVFATVLQTVPVLVSLLAARLELPEPRSYEVSTQVRSGCVIDLEIAATASNGEPGWLLWSEHKVRDPLTADQLEREVEELKVRAGARPRKLLAITLDPPLTAVKARAAELGVRDRNVG
jgi:hypothetical protein